MAHALPEVDFIEENIRMEQQLYATQDAYQLVTDEGLPFREAYRRVGEKLKQLGHRHGKKDRE